MVVAALAETSLIAHAKTSSPTDGFGGYYWDIPSVSNPSGFYKLANGFTIDLYLPANTYEIFAYCVSSPCYALGATANVDGLTDQNLPALWQYDPFETEDSKLFSDHAWHSAQFLFSNAEQQNFWHALLDEYGLLPN
jgi:hypothetical protein